MKTNLRVIHRADFHREKGYEIICFAYRPSDEKFPLIPIFRDKIFYENGPRYLIRKKYRNIEIFRKEESATAFQLVALAVLFKKKIRVFVFGYSNVVWVKGEKHHVGAALT